MHDSMAVIIIDSVAPFDEKETSFFEVRDCHPECETLFYHEHFL
jgi:hypothetical protein